MFKAERPFLLPLPAHRFYPTAPSSLPQFALYLADSKERVAVSHGHRTELPEPFLRFLDSTLWRLQPLIVVMMVGFWLTGLTGIVRSRLAKRKGVPVEFFVGATGFIALAVAELVSVTLIKQAALREIHPILSAPINP